MIINMLLVLVFLYLLPCVAGHGVNRVLKIDTSITKNYLVGNIFIWAMFQLVTVPLVLLKQNFSLVVLLINIIMIVICGWVIVYEVILKKCEMFRFTCWKQKFEGIKIADLFAIIAVFGILGWLFYKVITLQHTDADDSRFVVNAVEILRTNRMFLTDVITGQELTTWIGELIKDIVSPWAVYIAYNAKMTGISAVIMAHSVLPVSLILCGVSVFWLFSKEIFKSNISDRCIFMCLILLLNIYGCYSVYTAETFFLTRIWQGKATLASVAIPAMFLFCMWLYQKEWKFGNYALIALLNISMCLMSGMGTIIGAIMLASVGMIYGIRKKNIWVTLLMLEMCVPNVAYFLIKELQPNIWALK